MPLYFSADPDCECFTRDVEASVQRDILCLGRTSGVPVLWFLFAGRIRAIDFRTLRNVKVDVERPCFQWRNREIFFFLNPFAYVLSNRGEKI